MQKEIADYNNNAEALAFAQEEAERAASGRRQTTPVGAPI
jgi:hypothetical protein